MQVQRYLCSRHALIAGLDGAAEWLLLQGEASLGDTTIGALDFVRLPSQVAELFQLAPAGRLHGLVSATRDVLLYQRGDAELAVVSG